MPNLVVLKTLRWMTDYGLCAAGACDISITKGQDGGGQKLGDLPSHNALPLSTFLEGGKKRQQM